MIIKYDEEFPDKFEKHSHYCRICGEYVNKGDDIHKCSQDKLDNIIENQDILSYTNSLDDAFATIENMLDTDFYNLDEEGF